MMRTTKILLIVLLSLISSHPLSASAGQPLTINIGESARIYWYVQNVDACYPAAVTGNPGASISSAWASGYPAGSGSYPAMGSKDLGPFNTPGVFTFSCSNSAYSDSATVTVINPNKDPIGYLDHLDCSVAGGWTCDENNFANPLTVNVYSDGTYVGQTVANVVREYAVGAQCNGYTSHGFSYTIPSSLKDGNTHAITAYAVNTPAGNNPSLGTLSMTCAAPVWTEYCTPASDSNPYQRWAYDNSVPANYKHIPEKDKDCTPVAVNVQASCPAPGTTLTLTWASPSPLFTNFYPRTNDVSQPSPAGLVYADNVPGTTFTRSGTTPGQAYSYWIHTALASGEGSSNVASGSVTCAAPTWTEYCTDSTDPNGNTYQRWAHDDGTPTTWKHIPERDYLCNASCAGTTNNHCDVTGPASSGATSGSCSASYLGTCSYRCDNGAWTQVTNTCALPGVPVVSLTVSGLNGANGNTGTLSASDWDTPVLDWSATTAVTTCTVFKNGVSLGAQVHPYTASEVRAGQPVSYRVDCANVSGTGQSNTITIVVPPNATPGQATCSPSGLVTMNWSLPPGYSNTYLRAYDTTVSNVSPDYWAACVPQKFPPVGICTGIEAVSPYSFQGTPGATYNWYVHTAGTTGSWGTPLAGTSVTCASVSVIANPLVYNVLNGALVNFTYIPSTNVGSTQCRLEDSTNTPLPSPAGDWHASSPISWAVPNADGSYGYYVRCRNTINTTSEAVSNKIIVNTAAPAQCAASANYNGNHCTLTDTPSGGNSGSCMAGYNGSCSYSCSNGTWSQNSNSCVQQVATLTANPATVNSGSASTLTWTSNGTSCVAVGGFNTLGAANNNTGVSTGNLSGTSNFQLSCTNGVNSWFSNVATVTVINPTITLTATPNRLPTGGGTGVVSLAWDATSVKNTCSIQKNNAFYMNTTAADASDHISGTTSVSGITTQTTFTMTCTTLANATKSVTIIVNVGSGFNSF